ncbi:SIR2 family NAD-dependent protein deacylase [Pseudomonas putida]|uniref:SIR2 family NAD-dependent protein deacylase n=1 Tax=Pseudomonas putida TaxID=303 RepID=UPI000281E372|nr:NAD-dependent deacylase [Pseudomonas putida]EMR47936.1 NAD-dependent deacetylase [Pseudomonas putida LS46]
MPLTTIAKLLQEARHVVVFTGAGVSAESGIPTFRDALTGLWSRFDPAKLATAEAFREDPSLCWGWYESRRQKVLQAQPNAAHLASAELAERVSKLTVVTQNVDDLHERAGSQDVIHLHGSLHSPRCIDCGNAHMTPFPSDELPVEGCRLEPPRCDACNGYIRPGVVWFGEMLPEAAWSAGLTAAGDCDLFFSIGTSGVVYPAAELPLRALGAGATVVHVKPVLFEVSSREKFLQGPASVMQALVMEAFG